MSVRTSRGDYCTGGCDPCIGCGERNKVCHHYYCDKCDCEFEPEELYHFSDIDEDLCYDCIEAWLKEHNCIKSCDPNDDVDSDEIYVYNGNTYECLDDFIESETVPIDIEDDYEDYDDDY